MYEMRYTNKLDMPGFPNLTSTNSVKENLMCK